MIFDSADGAESVETIDVSAEDQKKFSLSDAEPKWLSQSKNTTLDPWT